MTVDELICSLQLIKEGGGGSLPVISKINVVKRVEVDCDCEEGCHEEKTEVIGEAEVYEVSNEMVPASRSDAKRKVVLR